VGELHKNLKSALQLGTLKKKILVTGGAGFIGSEFIRRSLNSGLATRIVNLDKLRNSGNLENLKGIEADRRYRFALGDVCDMSTVVNL
jgi:dTDP-glucose 4,6-dehydratase